MAYVDETTPPELVLKMLHAAPNIERYRPSTAGSNHISCLAFGNQAYRTSKRTFR